MHLRERMAQRHISKQELQRASKHGTKEYDPDRGCIRVRHGPTTLILDKSGKKGVTCFPTAEEDGTIWAAVKQQLDNPKAPCSYGPGGNMSVGHVGAVGSNFGSGSGGRGGGAGRGKVDASGCVAPAGSGYGEAVGGGVARGGDIGDRFERDIVASKLQAMGFDKASAEEAAMTCHGNLMDALEHIISLNSNGGAELPAPPRSNHDGEGEEEKARDLNQGQGDEEKDDPWTPRRQAGYLGGAQAVTAEMEQQQRRRGRHKKRHIPK